MVKRKAVKRESAGVRQEHFENRELGKIKKIVDVLERRNKAEIRKMKK
jgi:hypothetical protein